MKEVPPSLEKADYVLGYAWFSFGFKQAQGGPSALYDEKANLIPLGKYYATFMSSKRK